MNAHRPWTPSLLAKAMRPKAPSSRMRLASVVKSLSLEAMQKPSICPRCRRSIASMASFMSVAFLPVAAGGIWTGVSAYSWTSGCHAFMADAGEMTVDTLDGYGAESGRLPNDDRQERCPHVIGIDQQGKSGARCDTGGVWHRKTPYRTLAARSTAMTRSASTNGHPAFARDHQTGEPDQADTRHREHDPVQHLPAPGIVDRA